MKKRLVIFASGSGTNAKRLMARFANHPSIEVAALFANKPNCGAAEWARQYLVHVHIFTREELENGDILRELKKQAIDAILLAGFLWRIPADIVSAYANHIINIHPSLLPAHGGKGMYGMHVHRAVKEAGDHQTGITIHLVNEEYDKGAHLAQYIVPVLPEDEPEDIAKKVQVLEHEHLPGVVETYLTRLES